MKAFLKSGSFWFGILSVLFLGAGVAASMEWWGWLHSKEPATVSNSETLRNVGLLIGGGLAFVFAGWRAWVAERQANATQTQAQMAQNQADIAQKSLLNERYQRGAEMLGSEVLSTRLGGIYALEGLAEEHPSQYHIQIMKLFGSFVRNPATGNSGQDENGDDEATELREDVQAVMDAVGRRGEAGLAIEKEVNFTLDLRGANLSFARLSGANLEKANLMGAKFRFANFFDTHLISPDPSDPIPTRENQPQARPILEGEHISPDLAGMEDRCANLSLSILTDADLHGANLLGANLSGAQIMNVNLSESRIIYANFRRAVLLDANLSQAFMVGTDLSGAQLAGANLENAQLSSTKFCGADFLGASLIGADFSNAVLSEQNGKYVAGGLTQTQLDQVTVNMNNPPDLTGLVQVGTCKPLVWNARASLAPIHRRY